MKVFVTGASGFVGSAVVKELLSHGHEVRGLVRSDEGAAKLAATGAEVHRGDIYDLESIKSGATGVDAVVHTAFNHDFSKYVENCETDRKVIGALAEALEGSGKPLVVTSGIGLIRAEGRPITEDDLPPSSSVVARAASEEAAHDAAAKGVNAYILRLPPTTHGAGDHGFIPMVIGMDKQHGVSAYVGEGQNLWPATHRFDAAKLYRLIIEKQPGLKVFHAVAETGIPFKTIAETIGKGLDIPVESKTGDAIAAHFTWFAHFAAMGAEASAAKSIEATGWEPTEVGLLEDLVSGGYFN